MSQDTHQNEHHSRFRHKNNDHEASQYKPIHSEARSSKCFVFVLAAFVILFAVLLIFASIVRLRNPEVKLTSATLTQIQYNTSSSSKSFNATLIANLSIRNPNYGGGFSYENSTVIVLYNGVRFGDRKISSDTLNSRESRRINFTMNLGSGNVTVTTDGNLSSDINSGKLNLTSYVKLSGIVHLLKIINKRKTIEMVCVMNLNLSSHAVYGINC